VKIALPDFDANSTQALLTKTVSGYPQEFDSAFYGSVSIPEMHVKESVHTGLAKIVDPLLKSILVNHRMLSYFFLVKGIGNNSVLNLHQDWSIIDERKFRAYNLWIPLVDSTVENGTVHAIKGSHRFPLNIRGAGIPPKFSSNLEEAQKHLKPIDVKVGEALIFDSRILHYSPPNLSSSSRTSIINNIIPISAETMCFHGAETNEGMEVNRYDVSDDLFIHYDDFNNQKDDPNPQGRNKTKIDYENLDSISNSEFKLLLKQHIFPKKKWFFF
jgi:hypothetical protein